MAELDAMQASGGWKWDVSPGREFKNGDAGKMREEWGRMSYCERG